MKQFWLRLLSICGSALITGSLAGILPVLADDDDNTFTDQTLTYEKIEGGVKIVGANAGLTKVTIKETIDTYPILSIGEYAFSECTGLTSVEIQSGVRTIESGAFSGCSSLTEITLPDTLTSIGAGAFYYCTSLEEIIIPDSVSEIGVQAFSYCYALEHAVLPASLKTLPTYIFFYDWMLEDITLPEGLESIESMAFAACYSLKGLHIPASVTEIAELAVVSCPGIREITVGEGNAYYQANADGVLLDRTGKTLLLYPAGREEAQYAVPEGVSIIAAYAFAGSLNLKTVTLPESLAEIEEGAFSDCKQLEQIDYPAFTSIASSVFANCAALQSFTIPDSVTSIGTYAFYGCSELPEIMIPDSVTEIGEYAFFDCTKLQQVSVPDSVTEIGKCAFGFCADKENEKTAVQKGFVLQGTPNSAAKAYAKENGIQFDQNGVDSKAVLIGILIVLGALAAAVLCILAVKLITKRMKQRKAVPAVPAPEDTDPNYTSILTEEDEGDPYDRSYGFPADDPDDGEA